MWIGEIASITAAASWAIGLTLFRGPLSRRSATDVNLFKCASCTLMLWVTVGIWALFADVPSFGGQQILWMVLSGVIGLSVGDTLLFFAIPRLGGTRAMMIQLTSPLMTVLFGFLFLSEILSTVQVLAIFVCTGGTLLVVVDRVSGEAIRPGHLGIGIAAALAAALSQTTGLLLARDVFLNDEELARGGVFVSLTVAAVRLTAGSAGLIGYRLATAPKSLPELLCSRGAWKEMAIASLIGTYLGLSLQSLGLQFAASGIVSTLSSTTPLFLLAIGVLFLKHVYGGISYFGVLLGIAGVWLLLQNPSLPFLS